MTTDPLDEILDRSAPEPVRADAADLRTMILSAQVEAKESSPGRSVGRRRRAVVAGGVVALFLVGGAGVAVASSDWLWSEGLEDSDRVYTYTSPTWGECELRFSALDTHDIFTDEQVNEVIDRWFETTDVEAEAAPLVPKYLATVEDADAADPEAVKDPRQADLNAWTAHEQAVGELLHEELAANGFDSNRLAGAESHSQLHCDDEDWGNGK